MDNKLLNLLPIKSKFQTNSNSNYDRFNNYCFQICDIIDKKNIKLDIGEEKYIKILGYLHSKKWEKVIQNNCKHFFYNDLQLIVNEYGDQWCKKDKIFSYNTLQNNNDRGNDIRVSLYRTNKIPIDLFPPITTYHDIRKIVKICRPSGTCNFPPQWPETAQNIKHQYLVSINAIDDMNLIPVITVHAY